MARKLKVFRTAAGFHDAYVAAPSQKAALEAWGSNTNLFGLGMAELVSNEALTRAPLETPGKIFKVARGTADDHYAALPSDPPDRRGSKREKGDGDGEGDGDGGEAGPKAGAAAGANYDAEHTVRDGTRSPVKARASASGHGLYGKTATGKVAQARGKASPASAPESESARGSHGRKPVRPKAAMPAPPVPKPRVRPCPSLDRIDTAEAALDKARQEHRAAVEAIMVRERTLEQERRALEARQAKTKARLEATLDRAEAAYRSALDKWCRGVKLLYRVAALQTIISTIGELGVVTLQALGLPFFI